MYKRGTNKLWNQISTEFSFCLKNRCFLLLMPVITSSLHQIWDMNKAEWIAKEILKSCWKMNFGKHNKFKSYLDFSLRTSFLFKERNGTRFSVALWILWDFQKSNESWINFIAKSDTEFRDLWTGNGSAIDWKRWTITDIDGSLRFTSNQLIFIWISNQKATRLKLIFYLK